MSRYLVETEQSWNQPGKKHRRFAPLIVTRTVESRVPTATPELPAPLPSKISTAPSPEQ